MLNNFSNYRLFSTNTHTGNPEEQISIEAYFYEFYRLNKDKFPSDYEYIPVFWRSYEYGKRFFFAPEGLQEKLEDLDKDKKYFTICSSPTGISESLPKDTIVFSATGPVEGYETVPIPLSSYEHDSPPEQTKIIRCSFVGVSHTHSCREQMFKTLREDANFAFSIRNYRKTYENVASHRLQYTADEYKEYIVSICQSEFVLCPRGVSPTSQRLYDVLQLGAVPIYIYDESFLPYQESIDWKTLGIMIHESEIADIPSIIERVSREEIIQYRKNIEKVQSSRFTRGPVCNYILKRLHSIENK